MQRKIFAPNVKIVTTCCAVVLNRVYDDHSLGGLPYVYLAIGTATDASRDHD